MVTPAERPDDEELDAFLIEVRQRGFEMIAQQLRNLLSLRLEEDSYHWRNRMRSRLTWLSTYGPFHSPSHPSHPMYEEWARAHHYPKPAEN